MNEKQKEEKELFELAKKFGDNYTYGQIVRVLKERSREAKKEMVWKIKEVIYSGNDDFMKIRMLEGLCSLFEEELEGKDGA